MATQYAFGQIVTNGLVLSLNAADKNSYPGSGTTWTDMSGNGNNGTLTNGPTFSSANGGAIVFDGVDDFVNCGNNTSLDITGNLSVCTWVNTTGAINNRIIFAKQNLLNFNSNYEGYLNGNNVYWWDGVNERNTGLTVLSNTWTNIAYVRTSTTLTTYVNYNTVSTITVVEVGPISGNLLIGRDGNGQYFSGNIASIQIYNRALSAAEIQQNYTAQKSRFGL